MPARFIILSFILSLNLVKEWQKKLLEETWEQGTEVA